MMPILETVPVEGRTMNNEQCITVSHVDNTCVNQREHNERENRVFRRSQQFV
jgi:hypothetical protein